MSVARVKHDSVHSMNFQNAAKFNQIILSASFFAETNLITHTFELRMYLVCRHLTKLVLRIHLRT